MSIDKLIMILGLWTVLTLAFARRWGKSNTATCIASVVAALVSMFVASALP